ncbi:hypothetical protein DRW03_06340 [Corallococcus sp. H22C18031201]|nr:hypothetical protein DRW03_06340 [Corallococcus sp. H22C18031201]
MPMDATTNTEQPTPEQSVTPAAAEQPAPRRGRGRPPKSPDAKARGMAARKLARRAAKLAKDADVGQLQAAADVLERVRGKSDSAPPTALAPTPSQESAPLQGAPASVNPRGPAWPAPAAIAEMTPMVAGLVSQLALVLAGTRYAIDKAVEVEVGGEVQSVSGQTALTSALAPLAAKYLPSVINTPEAAAAVVVVSVFGLPAIAHIAEVWQRSKAEPGAHRSAV